MTVHVSTERMHEGLDGLLTASEVAEIEFGRAYATIQRTDRLRAVRVAADIDKTDEDANANRVVRDLTKDDLSQIASKFPGVSYNFEGEQKDQRQVLEEHGAQHDVEQAVHHGASR